MEGVSERMGMESVIPFMGMVIVQVAMVGQMVTGKEAILDGMTNFTFVFYFNALSFLILIFSSFFYRKSNNLPPLTYAVIWRCILFGILGYVILFGSILLSSSPNLFCFPFRAKSHIQTPRPFIQLKCTSTTLIKLHV